MALPLAQQWATEHGLVFAAPLTSVALREREISI
jgi:hypothetical protein